MQASANERGIDLSWFQDDFETLAGFNIYRSTSENGTYHKVNSFLIPAGQTTFFDDDVEPGQVYYYNFTVVLTDFTESDASGKVQVQAYDTMAPNIYHTPVYHAMDNRNIVVKATVVDNLQVEDVELYYRVSGSSIWHQRDMLGVNDRFTGIIQASHLDLEGMEYYIKVSDGINETYKGSEEAPLTIVIQEAINEDALGDVNGDGVINTLDALMVLQAMNGRINLTPEAFNRADLNQNGNLEPLEALMILQYVSGRIGSLTN